VPVSRAIGPTRLIVCGCAALVYLLTLRGSSFARQGDKQATDGKPDLKAFVGTWKASYKGDVFATLVLNEERGSLSGTLNNFDLSVDKEGNLTDGTHKDEGDARC
jgi:hypothetical protein